MGAREIWGIGKDAPQMDCVSGIVFISLFLLLDLIILPQNSIQRVYSST